MTVEFRLVRHENMLQSVKYLMSIWILSGA